jgi:hypothetical protein
MNPILFNDEPILWLHVIFYLFIHTLTTKFRIGNIYLIPIPIGPTEKLTFRLYYNKF